MTSQSLSQMAGATTHTPQTTAALLLTKVKKNNNNSPKDEKRGARFGYITGLAALLGKIQMAVHEAHFCHLTKPV